MGPQAVDTPNFVKYQTKNPVVRRLIDRFFERVCAIVAPLEPSTALDAGCGEGETIARLADLLPRQVFAIDILDQSVAFTRRRHPFVEASRQSIYELPFEAGQFDLVLCLEVLEHLDRPAAAAAELARVGSGDLVISVPFEPYFRLGSLLRGKHVTRLGNHPEHVNHWDRRSFASFLERHFDLREMTVAFPWLVAHCTARQR
jgi:2-polyprenyl-3-methyl-5-hydroxy-6-metoxy-1,4-benzoquinol methylase